MQGSLLGWIGLCGHGTIVPPCRRPPRSCSPAPTDALRMPPVETWETFPFDGDLRPRSLMPPVAEEAPRRGAGGVDCWRVCGA